MTQEQLQREKMDAKPMVNPFITITKMMKISGMYFNNNTGYPRRKLISRLYCGFVTIFLWMNVIRYMFNLQNESKISAIMMSHLTFGVFFLRAAAVSTAAIVLMPKHLPGIITAVNELPITVGTTANLTRIARNLKICLYVTNSMIVFGLIAYFVANNFDVFDNNQIMKDHLRPFPKGGPLETVGEVLLSIMMTVLLCQSICAFALYSAICHLIGSSYQALNNDISENIGNAEETAGTIVEKWRRDHDLIGNAVTKSNRALSTYVAIAYCAALPMTCFFLYAGIMGRLDMADILSLGDVIVFTLLETLLVTGYGVFVNVKAHSSMGYLFRFDSRRFSEKTFYAVSMFHRKLSSGPIGISVAGMFTIDKPAVLTLFGTLIAYVIVVLQFQPEDDSPDSTTCCETLRILLENYTRTDEN